MEKKQKLQGNARSTMDKHAEALREAQNIGKEIRNSTHIFARTVKQNPLTSDNLQKVQADRYRYRHAHTHTHTHTHKYVHKHTNEG